MPDEPLARLDYKGEVQRKLLHFLALVLPIGLLVLGRDTAMPLLWALALLALAADIGRLQSPWLNRTVEKIFGSMMRPRELQPVGGTLVLNGATWMCFSAALCATVFPPQVAAPALAILMVGDAAAAMVGMRMGRFRYPWSDKTFEGSLAFVIGGVLAAMPFAVLAEPAVGPGPILIAAVVAGVVEAAPLPVNDNVKVAMIAGAVIWILT